jgi:hypothetical protein
MSQDNTTVEFTTGLIKEAAAKQLLYANCRRAYTTMCLEEFKRFQDAWKAAHPEETMNYDL